jgi:hypothetical protein
MDRAILMQVHPADGPNQFTHFEIGCLDYRGNLFCSKSLSLLAVHKIAARPEATATTLLCQAIAERDGRTYERLVGVVFTTTEEKKPRTWRGLRVPPRVEPERPPV